MALVACPDCGAKISDQAPACIHCGRPMGMPPPSPWQARHHAPPSPWRGERPDPGSPALARDAHGNWLPRRRRWVWPLVLALGVSAAVVVALLTSGTGADSKPSFRPWTSAERAEVNAECQRRAVGGYRASECVAAAFCNCATGNYEMRQTPIAEYRSILAAVVANVDGRYGYFCTDAVKNNCK